MAIDKTTSIDFTTVESMMHQAVRDRVFPGAVLRIQYGRMPLYHCAYGVTDYQSKRPVTVNTIFDLASLTKPLATALAVLLLVQDGKMALEQPIGAILPEMKNTGKNRITLRHLLLHTSGLPAHRPYYKQLLSLPYRRRRNRLNSFLVSEPLTHAIGEQMVYSDIGFMILRWTAETVSGMRLDRFAAERIYRPLGLFSLYFIPSNAGRKEGEFAVTQWCPWRKCFLDGVVSDENAYASDGVDGHAGLFGSAEAVGDLLGELMAVYSGGAGAGVFQGEWVKRFLSRDQVSGRCLGFDMPTPGASSSGAYFSEQTVGHLGYTGVSFWSDLKTRLSVILLTNRVHPSVENNRIRAFRPEIHNAVMACALPGIQGAPEDV